MSRFDYLIIFIYFKSLRWLLVITKTRENIKAIP